MKQTTEAPCLMPQLDFESVSEHHQVFNSESSRFIPNIHKPRRCPLILATTKEERPQVSGEQVEKSHCIVALTLLTEQALRTECKHKGGNLKVHN